MEAKQYSMKCQMNLLFFSQHFPALIVGPKFVSFHLVIIFANANVINIHVFVSFNICNTCFYYSTSWICFHTRPYFVHACSVTYSFWLFEIPWTLDCQVPLSMEFPRQEYWRGVPFSTPGDLPNPGSSLCLLCLLHWQADSLPLCHLGSQSPYIYIYLFIYLLFFKFYFLTL